MAFNDLTPNQARRIINLMDALKSGRYKDDFLVCHLPWENIFVYLYARSDGKLVRVKGIVDSDIQAYLEEGYIRLSTEKDSFTVEDREWDGIKVARMVAGQKATLKAKAYEEYNQQHKSHEDSSTEKPTHNSELTLDIFISHSSKDVKIAEALIDLLRAALTLKADSIRCTSVDGYRLQAGASTDEQLRREIYEARVFIGLITPASLQSTYVLFELGARWGARRHLAPVLAAGFDAASLRAPLTSLNSLSCDIPAQVYQLVSDIASSIGRTAASPSAYQKYVNALVEFSRQRAEHYRSEPLVAEAATQGVSATRAQISEHDRNLFSRFLQDFPSQGGSIRFLREHDIGARFEASVLNEIYEFLRQWNDAEHEFNNPEIEDKRRALWSVLNTFIRELGQYASSTHHEGWLSIKETIGYEDKTKFFKVQERLNELATNAFNAHQDLIREGNRRL